jgi:hypothetical protein
LAEEDDQIKVEETRFGFRFKATYRKRRLEELTEKIPSTAIMKGRRKYLNLDLQSF